MNRRLLPAVLALGLVAGLPAGESDDTAYLMAVQITKRLRPTKKQVKRVSRMLAQVRRVEPAAAKLVPDANGAASSVIVMLKDGVKLASLSKLHERLGVERTSSFKFMNGHTVWFERAVNFERVRELYRDTPGVKSVSQNSIIGASAGARLRRADGGYRLSFWVGRGDCPAGCIEKDYWDFRFDKAGKLLGGGQRPDDGPTRPPSPGEMGGGMGISLPGGGLPAPPAPEIEFPAPGRPGTSR